MPNGGTKHDHDQASEARVAAMTRSQIIAALRRLGFYAPTYEPTEALRTKLTDLLNRDA